MAIVYRTDGAWGSGKGSQLVPAEVDYNFYALANQISALSVNPTPPLHIANFVTSGDTFSCIMSDASTIGPLTLPLSAFNWRGYWHPSTAYSVLDVFCVDDVGFYLVTIAHTSGVSFNESILVGTDFALAKLLGATTLYDLSFYYPGVPGAGLSSGSPLFQFVAVRPCYVPTSSEAQNAGQVYMATPPSSDLNFEIGVSSGTEAAGYIHVPSGSNTGYIVLHNDITLAAGDVLSVYQASSPSGADLSVSIMMLRGAPS